MDAVGIFDATLALPCLRARRQTSNKQMWSVPASGTGGDGAPGSSGGHAVPVVAYHSRSLTVAMGALCNP